MRTLWSNLGAISAIFYATLAFGQSSQPASSPSQAQGNLDQNNLLGGSSGKVKELSLAEAVKLALENAPDLQAAAAQADNAEARYEKAKDSRLPALTIGASANQYTSKQTICFAN